VGGSYSLVFCVVHQPQKVLLWREGGIKIKMEKCKYITTREEDYCEMYMSKDCQMNCHYAERMSENLQDESSLIPSRYKLDELGIGAMVINPRLDSSKREDKK